jgi:peptide/nickel transport system substrate-binding protein
MLALATIAAACGQASTTTSSSAVNTGKVGGKVVLGAYIGTTWTCQFNPFNPAVNFTSVGYIYEPLEFVDILKTNSSGAGQVTPWLATGSTWSNGYETLTFNIRDGVKWSDGQPFTAADVVYTFDAMETSPALDLNALWKVDGGPLTNVMAQGTNQVVFTFDASALTYFYYVADLVSIVPQHIWSQLDQSNLASYADTNPVGTGPYTMSTCSADNIKYLRNSDYWQSTAGHPVPQIEEMDYPAFLGNQEANLYIEEGLAQWGAQPIPDIQTAFIDKDPAHRHYWFPPTEEVSLFPNLTNSLLSNLAVREAISLALKRSDIALRGESGYELPANQTGIVTPTYQTWYESSLNTITYDPSKADQVLQAAGFTKGSNGIYQNANGQQLSFTIKTISGFTDWDASLQIITQDLQAVGIQVTVEDENSTIYTTDVESGNFQIAYAGGGGPYALAGPTPYYELRGDLFSGNIGSTNYERYASPSTDALFNEYAETTNLTQQQQMMDEIETVMIDDMPFIPVTEAVAWYTYDDSTIGGWPSASNPYAQPEIYSPLEDNGVIMTHLYPLS